MKKGECNITINLVFRTGEPICKICEIMEFTLLNKRKGSSGTICNGEEYSEGNVLYYGIRHKNVNEIGDIVQSFLSSIPNLKSKLEIVKLFASCEISFSVVSELAQIGYTLSQEDLSQICELGLPLHFSILSFGMVENDT